MLKGHLKTAFRSLARNRIQSGVNIFGLAIGFTAVILILLFIYGEFSYDRFHENKDALYRVSIKRFREGKLDGDGPQFTPPLGPAMLKDFPEIKNFARISSERVGWLSSPGKEPLKTEQMHHADPSLLEIFSFPLVQGDAKTALAQPYSIVLTEQTAKKIFDKENAVGKIIRIDNKDDYTVTAVAKDPPLNSTIRFNALISFATLYNNPNLFLGWDGGNQYTTFVLLQKNATAEAVNAKLPALLWKPINEKYTKAGARLEAYLQPLGKLHLYHEENSASLRSNISIFSIVAIFILLIACVNFVNLTTARASKRAKEVGVRKVLGAGRKKLIGQFLTESLLLTLIAFIVSIVLLVVAAPLYEQVFGKPLDLGGMTNITMISAATLLFFLVGLVIGIYPAFHVSRFDTIRTLKGMLTKEGKPYLRNALVIIQFTISIALIASTLVIFQQQQYIRNKKLGFTKDNIVVLPLTGQEAQAKVELLKQQLKGLPAIASVSASSDVPHRGFTTNGYKPEGVQNYMQVHVVDADEDFLNTYNIPLVDGSNFSKERPLDKSGFLINETLAKTLGWKNPVGKKIERNGVHEVIGVVKDFYFASLHDKIEPLIITNTPWADKFDYLAIHYNSDHTPQLLNDIKQQWKKIVPATPFDYWFLNDSFNELYKSEQQFQHGFLYSSILAIVLAMLGIFGLVSFSVERRTKEIGIRKVLGASSISVAGLLSKDFLVLVLLANILAWPLAWHFMHRWLEDFANRIELSWWIFLVAALLAVFIALLTVGLQALKAALANPVKNLKTE
jgi:putative ABC transport system permease protein